MLRDRKNRRPASLEALVESGDLGLQILHPGGLEMTQELAEMCHVNSGKRLLDVACGTGESACYLAHSFGCIVIGVDHSAFMVEIARRKARDRTLQVQFQQAEAHDLPFAAGTFDAVISECTICALEKEKVIGEMVRVTKPGGWAGISDLYWKQDAPAGVKQRLAEIEDERPEEIGGWARVFEQAGLQDVQTVDRSHALASMSSEMREQLGARGYAKVILTVLGRWGFRGITRVMESERIFRCQYLGYAIVVGRKG